MSDLQQHIENSSIASVTETLEAMRTLYTNSTSKLTKHAASTIMNMCSLSLHKR